MIGASRLEGHLHREAGAFRISEKEVPMSRQIRVGMVLVLLAWGSIGGKAEPQ